MNIGELEIAVQKGTITKDIIYISVDGVKIYVKNKVA